MILNRPLNEAELASSQKNYILYCGINGFSYMCLGETILSLFAINLKCDDTIIAILGSMIYFSYMLVPLGKITVAKVGAAHCQADFWVRRNIAAFLVAMAAPISIYINHTLATCLIVLGAFLFYGFRAAGVVMSQPLVGEICEKSRQGGFISRSWVYFYGSGLTALLLITYARYLSESVWVLFGIILTGTLFGFVSSGFLRKIHETGQIRESARKPVFAAAKAICRMPVVRSQLLAGIVGNLFTILIVPISTLTLKRGFNVSDSQALIFSLAHFGGAIALSMLLARIADKLGGRKLILAGYYGFYLIALFWLLAPKDIWMTFLFFPFLLGPCGGVVISNSMSQYFLATVPKEHQVAASIATLVGTGFVSGLLGMVISSSLLKLAAYFNDSGIPLTTYRYYYGMVLVLLPLFSFFMHRLKKESQIACERQD